MTYSFDLKIRLVNYYNNNLDESLRTISNNFDISKSSLHRWINNICLDKTSRETEYKDRATVLKFLKKSLYQNPFQTLEMLKTKISNKFNLSLSKKTISNYLNIVGYSKKKITRRLYNKNLKEHLLTRKKMKKFLKKLNKDDLVCLDESGIHRKLFGIHGWCAKNERLIRHMRRDEVPINHSLLMAISKDGVLKYELYKQQAVNTNIYYAFLEDLLKNIKNKYILADNVSFHKSPIVIDLIKKSGNIPLFIPPYSPDFNPIEEVFSKLKAFLRRHITPVTLNKDIHKLLKKFVKSVDNFEGYYRHAFE